MRVHPAGPRFACPPRFPSRTSFWSDSPEQANAAAVNVWSDLAEEGATEDCDSYMAKNLDGKATKPGEPHSSYGLINHNATSLRITVTRVNDNP